MIFEYTNRDGETLRTPPLTPTASKTGWRTVNAPIRWFVVRYDRLYELDAHFRMRLVGINVKETKA